MYPPGDIDLRPRMQAVGNQGSIGSCTGWAGTAALEAKLGDGQRSPLYVYYYDRLIDGTPPSQDAGATMLGLCKALRTYGAPPEAAWPYVPSAFSSEPSRDARAHAATIDAYYQVQGSGMSLLQGVWAALDAGETPLLAINVYPSFEFVGTNGKVPMPLPGEQVLGGHAITACCWFNDQSAPGGYGYVGIQNSWGQEIGDGGYFYLPAGYFLSGIVREAWVIAVTAPVPPPPPPEPEPEVDVNAIKDRLNQIDECVSVAQGDRCPYGATLGQYRTSMVKIMDEDIGPIRDLVRECQELLNSPKVDPGPEPGPSPSPPPPAPLPSLAAVYGTYSGHGLAQDAYPGTTDEQVQWGPHHGLPLVAPVDGRVELYQIGTPLTLNPPHWLGATDLAAYQRNWHAISDGWTCRTPPHYGAQTMYVAVFWPNDRLFINGQRVGHLHYGHVRSDVKTGPVSAGDTFAWTWDSGIRFENAGIATARAAHVHCCAGSGTTLSPNGDLDGRLAIAAQGWRVTDIQRVPGPQDYLTGNVCAGRPLADFRTAGRPIPPMPGWLPAGWRACRPPFGVPGPRLLAQRGGHSMY